MIANQNLPCLELLVCISTQQEITNVLPAIEQNIPVILLFVTTYARKQGWPNRLRNAIDLAETHTRVTEHLIEPELEDSPSAFAEEVLKVVRSFFCEENDVARLPSCQPRVGFAWGGGSKPLSTGLWLAYEKMCLDAPEVAHQALYADATKGQLLLWTKPKGFPSKLRYKKALSVPVRLASYGVNIKQQGARIWPQEAAALPDWLPQAYRLFCSEPEYRRFCFELAAAPGGPSNQSFSTDWSLTNEQLLNIVDSIVKKYLPVDKFHNYLIQSANSQHVSLRSSQNISDNLRQRVKKALLEPFINSRKSPTVPASRKVLEWLKECNPENKGLALGQGIRINLAPNEPKFSFLFEKLMAFRTLEWLKNNPYLVEAAFTNVECVTTNNDDVLCEFDLLLLSSKGKLIAIDAKSFEIETHKKRAQIAAVQGVGGISTGFRFCFPMFVVDIGAPDISRGRATWGEQPWFPQRLLNQIAIWRTANANMKKDALPLLPFDQSDTFEKELSLLCQ